MVYEKKLKCEKFTQRRKNEWLNLSCTCDSKPQMAMCINIRCFWSGVIYRRTQICIPFLSIPFNDCNETQNGDDRSLILFRYLIPGKLYIPPPACITCLNICILSFIYWIVGCVFLKERKRKRSEQSIYVYDKHT